jgi:tRNA pseudouridine55 synthase
MKSTNCWKICVNPRTSEANVATIHSWDGLLLIDKPADITSHDVVHRVRQALRQKSVGHTGTLDPMATGLMILVLGEATKLSDYLMAADKAYWLKVRLGVTTDTLDRTGQVLREAPCNLTPAQVREGALALQGKFQWPVPLFSAAKIEGKKLYEYGRQGREVELPVKRMDFWGVEVEETSALGARLSLQCSKGSFIRTWASQLGEKLGVGGILEELRRLRVGAWRVEQALPLEAVGDEARVAAALLPMAQALPAAWPSVVAGEKDARLISNGQISRDLANRLVVVQKEAFARETPMFVRVLSGAGELLAILAAEAGQGLKIRRVFRTNP